VKYENKNEFSVIRILQKDLYKARYDLLNENRFYTLEGLK
jgi:hypothetical protein